MTENNNYNELANHIEKNVVKTILENKNEKESLTGKTQAQITPRQWREIELLWASGEVTLRELANKYGKTKDTFANHFKKKGIKKGSRAEELNKIAEQVAKEDARQQAEVIAKRINDTKEEHYKMAETLAKLTFREILDCRQSGRPFRQAAQDLKALQIAVETIKRAREERWVTLGLDKEVVDEQSLPELVVSTMTPEQIEKLRNAQNDELDEVGFEDNSNDLSNGDDDDE